MIPVKKIIAVAFLVMAAGWAVYLYGFVRNADAESSPATSYQQDGRLPELVHQLDLLNADLRRQLELLEHAKKQQEAEPPSTLLPDTLKDPFSPAA